MRLAGSCVSECLYQDVEAGVLNASKPVEEEVARLDPRRGGELLNQRYPAVGKTRGAPGA